MVFGEILRAQPAHRGDERGRIPGEVELVRVEEYSRTATTSAFDTSGMLKRLPDLPPLDRSGEEAYVRRYLTSFMRGGLSGLRVLSISIRR
jgi:hypothetical protein